MAIVRSIAMGNSRKSAGNVTFRTVRGRLVASQKITQNPNYIPSAAQIEQRTQFGKVFSWARSGGSIVRYLFAPTKYGNSFNQLMKKNWPIIKNQTFTSGDMVSLESNPFKWLLQLVTTFAITGTATKAQYVSFGRAAAAGWETDDAFEAKAGAGDSKVIMTGNIKVFALPESKVRARLIAAVGDLADLEKSSVLSIGEEFEIDWDADSNSFIGQVSAVTSYGGVAASNSVVYAVAVTIDGVPVSSSSFLSVESAKASRGICGILPVTVS